jgi:hypothetical protein
VEDDEAEKEQNDDDDDDDDVDDNEELTNDLELRIQPKPVPEPVFSSLPDRPKRKRGDTEKNTARGATGDDGYSKRRLAWLRQMQNPGTRRGNASDGEEDDNDRSGKPRVKRRGSPSNGEKESDTSSSDFDLEDTNHDEDEEYGDEDS